MVATMMMKRGGVWLQHKAQAAKRESERERGAAAGRRRRRTNLQRARRCTGTAYLPRQSAPHQQHTHARAASTTKYTWRTHAISLKLFTAHCSQPLPSFPSRSLCASRPSAASYPFASGGIVANTCRPTFCCRRTIQNAMYIPYTRVPLHACMHRQQ